MKRVLLLLFLMLQFSSCENPFAVRTKADFIPITEVGNYWLYRSNLGSEKYVEVVENSDNLTIDQREVLIVSENYLPYYWYKGEGFLSRYRDIEINFGGELYPIETRWQDYVEIPLVLGNEWQDLWQDTVVVMNQPLYRVDELRGAVVAIEDISTEVGDFEHCYKIRFNLTEEIHADFIGDSIIERTFFEWYAPDVGMVRSVQGNQHWELSEYGNTGEGD